MSNYHHQSSKKYASIQARCQQYIDRLARLLVNLSLMMVGIPLSLLPGIAAATGSPLSCNAIYAITSDATNTLLKSFNLTNGTTTTVATMGAEVNAFTLGIDPIGGNAYYVANDTGATQFHVFSYNPISGITTDTGTVIPIASSSAALWLGFDQTGVAYVVDVSFNAWSFTPGSNVVTSLGVIGGMGGYNGGDIAFDSNNVGWSVSRNTTNGNYALFRITKAGNSLTATKVNDLQENGSPVTNGANIGSIAFGPDENLYIVRSSDGHSWKIDPKTAIATTIATSIANNGPGLSDFASCLIPTIAAASSISGIVFEDVNYGGGAGRNLTAAGGVVRPNARVELYNSAGAFKGFDTTDAAGLYTFDSTNVTGGVIAGDYTVRVVNSTVKSSRPGSVAGLLPVQTYRTNASTGNAIADPNRVGGEVPRKVDAGNGSTTLASLTTGTTAAESIAPVKIVGTTGVAGVDFGYNFDTIVNTNDAGQGSLRQFITNSNALTNAGLDQDPNSTPAPGTTAIDPAAGQETSIFMISDGTGRPGLPNNSSLNLLTGGLASLTLNTTLPNITDSNTSVDARTQTINIGNTNAGLLGQASSVSGAVGVGGQAIADIAAPEVSLALNNLPLDVTLYVGTAGGATVNNTLIAGLAFISKNNDYRGQLVLNASNNTTITDNTFGVSTSLTDPGTASQSGQAIDLSESNTAQTISNVTVKNNLFAYMGFNGLRASFYNADKVKVNGVLVQSNQFLSIGARSNGAQINGECMIFSGQVNNAKVLGNLFKQCGGTVGDNGIEVFLNTGSATGNGGQPDILIQNNTLQNNTGVGISIASVTSVPNPAIKLDRNIITGTKAVSATAGGNAIENTLTGVTITQNSLFDNDKLGIDLGVALGGVIVSSGGVFGVNANNGTATLSDANKGMDYPIFTSSSLSGTGTLTVKGFVGNNSAGSSNFANAKLEFFIADNTPANQDGEVILGDGKSKPHGEGKTYIGSCSAGATGLFTCTFANAGTLGLTDAKNITATATDPAGNTSEFSAVPSNKANVLMVKRITSIKDGVTGTVTPYNTFVDDTTSTTATNDNNCGWPGATGTGGVCTTNTYTVGATSATALKVKPGDEIEYTIYYLNTGDNRATARVCDRLDPNLTFQPNFDATHATKGIVFNPGNTGIAYLTNTGTDGDKGQLTTDSASLLNCNLTGNTGRPVVAVDVGDATTPLLGSTGAGAPTGSYGYIRFKAVVN